MSELMQMLKEFLSRFIAPLAVTCLAGAGGCLYQTIKLTDVLETRVIALEEKVSKHDPLTTKIERLETTIERHEKALDRDFTRHEQIVASLTIKTEDQEKRLTRLETLVSETQRLLGEIRTDLKTLISGSRK